MEFNFYDQFQHYSNVEILKIIRQPGVYQPEAIATAIQILNSRQISEEEKSEVDIYFQNIEAKEKKRQEIINSYKNKAKDFFEPILEPTETVNPGKWLNIFLLIIALEYIWEFYNSIKFLIQYLSCRSCSFDLFACWLIFSLLYVPVIFILLIKRKRWGWILLFAYNLFIFVVLLPNLYFYFTSSHIFLNRTIIYQILIRGFFTAFLWSKSITVFFDLNSETKNNAAIITSIIAIGVVILWIVTIT